MSCGTCKMGEDAIDNDGVRFVFCRALPPRPIVINDTLAWVVPPMQSRGGCALHRLSIRKAVRGLLGGNGRKGA